MNKDIHKKLDECGIKKVLFRGAVIHPMPEWPDSLKPLFRDDYHNDSEVLFVLMEALKKGKESINAKEH